MRLRLFPIIACLGVAGSAVAQPAPTPSPQTQPPAQPTSRTTSTDTPKTTVDGRLKALEDRPRGSAGREQGSPLGDRRPEAEGGRSATHVTERDEPGDHRVLERRRAHADNKAVFTPDGTRIDDRPFMRTMEVDFRAAVDPYADAVAILALEDNGRQGLRGRPRGGLRDPEAPADPRVGAARPQAQARPLSRADRQHESRAHARHCRGRRGRSRSRRLLGTENGRFFESGYDADRRRCRGDLAGDHLRRRDGGQRRHRRRRRHRDQRRQSRATSRRTSVTTTCSSPSTTRTTSTSELSAYSEVGSHRARSWSPRTSSTSGSRSRPASFTASCSAARCSGPSAGFASTPTATACPSR